MKASIVELEVGSPTGATVPPVGVGVASHDQPLGVRELELLQAVRAAHLRVDVDVADHDASNRLARAAAEASALRAELEVAVIYDGEADGGSIDGVAAALSDAPVARVLVLPRGPEATSESAMDAVAPALAAAGVDAPLGGGTNAFFAELNSAGRLPDACRLAAFPITPQVHTFDEISIVETLPIQAIAARTARALLPGRGVVVSPVTLKWRFNPFAEGSPREPAAGELPEAVDPRQMSLFCAAWTLASVGHLVAAGVASATYYETSGWRGIVETERGSPPSAPFPSLPGMAFPVYHVLADVCELRGADLVALEQSDHEALKSIGTRRGVSLTVLLANTTSQTVRVVLRGLSDRVSLRVLDETTAPEAVLDPLAYRAAAAPVQDAAAGLPIDLLPYATARVDTTSVSPTGLA
ncbi:MAG: hypothetical protein ACRDNG_07220 [Gaiellaceae bacterium]